MSSYYEKLKDPRWQKRRLEIFSAAGFRCQECFRGDRPLHAHHLEYVKGKDPWAYSDSQIVCLCEDCHQEWHEAKAALDSVVAGLTAEGLSRALGYALAISSISEDNEHTHARYGFKGKGWTGLLGPCSGSWVKGLADALNGLRDDGDDSAAWKVTERLDDQRCQASKKQIVGFVLGEDPRNDGDADYEPLTESLPGDPA